MPPITVKAPRRILKKSSSLWPRAAGLFSIGGWNGLKPVMGSNGWDVICILV